MIETAILEPLPEDTDVDSARKHRSHWDKIANFLKKLKKEIQDLDFADFLKELGLSYEHYILAVRSSLKSKKLYLKRKPGEICVNNYNPVLLECWRANMDLQYIVDPYACAMYIVSYVAKSQRGMSNLMYNAAKEAREGNKDIREQVKHIGNKFLNNVEISAQEAVYYLLQMPLYRSSRDVIFINTSPSDKRSVMLKSHTVIQSLPDDCPDVINEGMLDHYSNRPEQLTAVCLADFVSKYKRIKQNAHEDGDEKREDDEDEQSHLVLTERHSMEKGYVLVKRRKYLCIRYVRFQEDKDPENYYRETLMLFWPWRREEELLGECSLYHEHFNKLLQDNQEIVGKIKEYQHRSTAIDDVAEKSEQIEEDLLVEQWDEIAPGTQCLEKECASVSATFKSIDVDDNSPEAVELTQGLGMKSKSDFKENFIINMIKDAEYYELIRSLNDEQREIFYYILNRVKNQSEEHFFLFLTGGAGVGKTATTRAVYQMLLRYLNKAPGFNPDDVKVLLAAPTGKAAFLIGGNTLHYLFHIPASQGLQYKRLSHEKLNSLRCQYKHVKILIIDECSMVGNQMINFVNQRLKEIMGNAKDFGGLSVIAVGDLYQLKPVFDGWIFSDLKKDYGPLARNIWVDLFKIFSLQQVMRQKDDLLYAKLLNRLRDGNQTSADLDLLRNRTITHNVMSTAY